MPRVAHHHRRHRGPAVLAPGGSRPEPDRHHHGRSQLLSGSPRAPSGVEAQRERPAGKARGPESLRAMDCGADAGGQWYRPAIAGADRPCHRRSGQRGKPRHPERGGHHARLDDVLRTLRRGVRARRRSGGRVRPRPHDARSGIRVPRRRDPRAQLVSRFTCVNCCARGRGSARCPPVHDLEPGRGEVPKPRAHPPN